MKKLILLVLLCFSAQANSDFLNMIKNKEINLAFDDGEINTISFTTNKYGITTATYRDERGKEVKGMSLRFVIIDDVEYLKLYKDRKAPSGTYKYSIKIFIPTDYRPYKSKAFVDARWGFFKRPLFFIE